MPRTNLALVHDSSAPPLTPERLSDRDGDPRIRDLDLAERLGFAKAAKVRELIDRNAGELRTYGDISVAVTKNTDPQGRGRPGKENWLNEGQALVICALSRTPQAAAVRKQVIEGFLAYRRGKLAAPKPETVDAIPKEAKAGLDALRQDARALAEAATALLARVDQREQEMEAAARKTAKRLTAPVPALVAPAAERGPMLMGIVAIAAHLGVTPRQAKYRAETGMLPVFKMGRAVCSSRAALDAFVASRLTGKEVRS